MENIKLAYLSDIHLDNPHDKKFLDEFSRHFEVYSFGIKETLSFYFKINRLREFLLKVRPDVIFANYLTKYPLLVYLTGVDYPMISVGWGSDVIYNSAFFPYPILLRKVCSRSCAVIVDSYYCKRILNRYCKEDKIHVIPFGVDTELFKKDHRRDIIREKHSIQNELVVISLRNHYKLYNIETIIKSARYFNNNIILMIAGKGKETSKLQHKARKLKNVIFLGMLSRTEVAAHLAASDVIVSVPYWDSTSVSLLEGMASGCVPIVSDIPANREWINNGENGFIVNPRDFREIARIVNSLNKNREILTIMGSRNREIIIERAEWKNNANKIVELIRRCI